MSDQQVMMKRWGALLIMLTLLFWAPAQASPPLGSDLYIQIKPARVTTKDLDRIAEAGFAGVRFSIRWYQVEREPGVYHYRKPVHQTADGYQSLSYEQLAAELAARDLKALVLLFGGNPLHTGAWQDFMPPKKKLTGRSKSRRLLPPPDDAEEIDAFEAFAAHTAGYFSNEYGPKRFTWLIWNEPNLWGFYPPAPDPQTFAPLLTQSCEAIRNAVPGARIAGPGFANDPDTWWDNDLDYMTKMLSASNALTCLDALTFHPYRPVHPETVAKSYKEIEEAMAPFQPTGRTVPVAVDEWGYSIRGGVALPVDAEKQGMYLTRAYLMNQLSGVPFTSIYEWRNSGTNPEEREHNFGLIAHDGFPKPGIKAFTRLLSALEGYTLIERLTPERCPDNMYMLLYRRDNVKKIAAWHESGTAPLTIGEDTTVTLEEAVQILPIADESAVRCVR